MEKILISFLVVCVVVKAAPRQTQFKKVACTNESEKERNELIEKSMCGPPREVFVHLPPRTSYEEIRPGAVWVKRCQGLCDYSGAECQPLETVTRHIPIRVHNLRTRKETCSTYQVVEHVSCGCGCASGECAPPHVFSPSKCACQCPNVEERRSCLHKRKLNMRWSRSKCACERRRKT